MYLQMTFSVEIKRYQFSGENLLPECEKKKGVYEAGLANKLDFFTNCYVDGEVDVTYNLNSYFEFVGSIRDCALACRYNDQCRGFSYAWNHQRCVPKYDFKYNAITASENVTSGPKYPCGIHYYICTMYILLQTYPEK